MLRLVYKSVLAFVICVIVFSASAVNARADTTTGEVVQQVSLGSIELGGFEQLSGGTAGSGYTSSFEDAKVVSLDSIDFASIPEKFDLTVSGSFNSKSYGGVTSSYTLISDNSVFYVLADGVRKDIEFDERGYFNVAFKDLTDISELLVCADFICDITINSSMVVFTANYKFAGITVSISESKVPETGEDSAGGSNIGSSINDFVSVMGLVMQLVQQEFVIYGHTFSYWHVIVFVCLGGIVGCFIRGVFS